MGERMYHGGAVGAFLLAADISGNTDDDSSSVHSSSTENMADIVSGFEGDERDGSEADGDGGSQNEEGDALDDDAERSEDSGSTGSLVDFIVPDWEMEDGDEGEAVEDDDYEDDGSTDQAEEEDNAEDNKEDDSPNSQVARPKRACSADICDAPSGRSLLVGRLHDAVFYLDISKDYLHQLAREFETERVNALRCTIAGRATVVGGVGGE